MPLKNPPGIIIPRMKNFVKNVDLRANPDYWLPVHVQMLNTARMVLETNPDISSKRKTGGVVTWPSTPSKVRLTTLKTAQLQNEQK